jgi:hypothetical protein
LFSKVDGQVNKLGKDWADRAGTHQLRLAGEILSISPTNTATNPISVDQPGPTPAQLPAVAVSTGHIVFTATSSVSIMLHLLTKQAAAANLL